MTFQIGNTINLGRKTLEKTKNKIGLANKGHFVSKETRQKISQKNRGRKAWNKGLKARDFPQIQEAIEKANAASRGKPAWNKGKKMGEEFRKKISRALMGRNPPKTAFKKGHIPFYKGKKLPKKVRIKIGLKQKGKHRSPSTEFKKGNLIVKRESEHHSWKGGITPLTKLIRTSVKYANWRKTVFERDDYTCQHCDMGGNILRADHFPNKFSFLLEKYKIKTVQEAFSLKELWDINNGRTLCDPCHKRTHKLLCNA